MRKQAKPVPLLQPKNKDIAFSKFAVYPNPVLPNASFTIDTKEMEAGNYLLQIISSSGEVVPAREVVIDRKSLRFTSKFDRMAAGPYFIKLTNKKTNKSYPEIIIVQ